MTHWLQQKKSKINLLKNKTWLSKGSWPVFTFLSSRQHIQKSPSPVALKLKCAWRPLRLRLFCSYTWSLQWPQESHFHLTALEQIPVNWLDHICHCTSLPITRIFYNFHLISPQSSWEGIASWCKGYLVLYSTAQLYSHKTNKTV